MNFNDDQNNTNGNDNSNEVKFQEYYENEGGDEKLMMTDGKNIANFQEIMDENLIKNIINRKNEINEKKDEFQNININEDNQHNDIIEDGNDKNKNLNNNNLKNDNDNDNDSLEREEMENEYELVKSLNDLKEKNKKLEAMNNYQKIKIESLENELEKANNKLKLAELELNELKTNNNSTNNKTNVNSNTAYINQIYNLNTQLDKYKNLVNDKKSEYKLLLDKYNDIQKKYNQLYVNEKKKNQELINKDKQIVKLLDDLDKKNVSIVSTTAQQMKDKENEKLILENKKLEKQKNDLYAAFKKSLKLCSILKKQKVHLENARLLAFTEEEFKNLMEENKI
jgi:hypothetical protein